ncbi:hypothetical protein IJI94_02400 [Candidatus Saccharibacteria bacterium]|nr:hypothetical protein [Candidatus Saccharibacteria bacterium]
MENRIRKYEKFITEQLEKKTKSKDLWQYHQEMVADFQHERLVHLLIMLFFIFITLAVTAANCVLSIITPMDFWCFFIPMYILNLLLIILSIAYVKHYYFLENHIQKLYDLTEKFLKK